MQRAAWLFHSMASDASARGGAQQQEYNPLISGMAHKMIVIVK